MSTRRRYSPLSAFSRTTCRSTWRRRGFAAGPGGSLGVEGGERGGVGERLDVRWHRRRRKPQQFAHLALLLVLNHLLLVRRRAALWHEGLDRRRALDLAERRRRVGALLRVPIRDLDLMFELAGQLLPLGRQQRAEASGLPAHVDHPQMRTLLQHAPVRRRQRVNVGGERVRREGGGAESEHVNLIVRSRGSQTRSRIARVCESALAPAMTVAVLHTSRLHGGAVQVLLGRPSLPRTWLVLSSTPLLGPRSTPLPAIAPPSTPPRARSTRSPRSSANPSCRSKPS